MPCVFLRLHHGPRINQSLIDSFLLSLSISLLLCFSGARLTGIPGWITFWASRAKQDLIVRVWVPVGVEVFLRPPFPCPSPLKSGRGEGSEEEVDGEISGAVTREREGVVAGGDCGDYDDDESNETREDVRGYSYWNLLAPPPLQRTSC